MPKAIVTGASGFIGSALMRHLDEAGWSVVGVDRVRRGEGTYPFITADVARAGSLDGLLDRETTIFHMAASADVAKSVADPRADPVLKRL